MVLVLKRLKRQLCLIAAALCSLVSDCLHAVFYSVYHVQRPTSIWPITYYQVSLLLMMAMRWVASGFYKTTFFHFIELLLRFVFNFITGTSTPVAPAVTYQVIFEPGIGHFREFESPRMSTRISSRGLFLLHKLTCGKPESVSYQQSMENRRAMGLLNPMRDKN